MHVALYPARTNKNSILKTVINQSRWRKDFHKLKVLCFGVDRRQTFAKLIDPAFGIRVNCSSL